MKKLTQRRKDAKVQRRKEIAFFSSLRLRPLAPLRELL
jgi:hypothetical protein